MMYQDSIDQAGEKAALAIAFLQRHRLAAHPVNYTVAYDYITGANAQLCQAIEQKLAARIPFDDFVMTELYSNFISTNNKENDQLVNRVGQLVNKLTDSSDYASEAISEYIEILDQSLVALKTDSPAQARDTLHRVLDATYDVRTSQQKLKDQLQYSHQQTEMLREELEQLKRNRQVDPLTGLYNRLAMQEHVDLWLTENPKRKIAAIAVDLDHFRQFNQDYGFNIGDVILSKVAKKISAYVQESGLPVRAGGEEFLILLPDVDLRTAGEIAEQVRRGVEKLRFVSSRSKKALPKVTISLGVALFQAEENWHQFLARSTQVLQVAKRRGRNQVATEAML
jgi:diguanylate cyclase